MAEGRWECDAQMNSLFLFHVEAPVETPALRRDPPRRLQETDVEPHATRVDWRS
ncbi:hypothetical protein MY4824_007224 [Beauveria thailandica]